MISSKNDQKSEYQGETKLDHIHKNQQPDDVILSKNNQLSKIKVAKDALEESINNHSLDKNNHKDVEGNNNRRDEATIEKELLDNATSDKSNQKTNKGKDDLTNSTINPSPEKSIH